MRWGLKIHWILYWQTLKNGGLVFAGNRVSKKLEILNMDGLKLKISVVICTFNGGNFIDSQLKSVLGQSRPPDEVIICDDASMDNTVDIVSRIASAWPLPVRIIQNSTNLGCVKNFEQAIKLATGNIIFLSDQDDVWFKDKIAIMSVPFIEDNSIGLVYSDAIITDEKLKPAGRTLFSRRRNLQVGIKRLAHQLVRGVGINGCTMAFRSSLKEFVLPISEGWGHDHWIAFIAHAVMDIRPIDKPLMFYRRHANNTGIDSTLEDGCLTKWRTVLRAAAGAEVYTGDRRRWESMCRRLREISSKRCLAPENQFILEQFLEECEQRLELARLRERLKLVARIRRGFPLLRVLFKGNYHRHLRGMKSFFKDVLIR